MSGERVVGVFGLIEGRPDDTPTAPPPHLTPRQVEVLRLLEQGRSTKQIAAELHLSTETVRNHIRRLFRALGVHSRLEAVASYLRLTSGQPVVVPLVVRLDPILVVAGHEVHVAAFLGERATAS